MRGWERLKTLNPVSGKPGKPKHLAGDRQGAAGFGRTVFHLAFWKAPVRGCSFMPMSYRTVRSRCVAISYATGQSAGILRLPWHCVIISTLPLRDADNEWR